MTAMLRAIPLAIAFFYVCIILLLCDQDASEFAPLIAGYGRTMIPVWLIVGLVALLVATVQRHRAGNRTSPFVIARDFLTTRWASDRLASVIIPFLCFVPLVTAYNIFKALYLPGAGFWAGKYIARSERALLGGQDAWRLTHSLLSNPWATQAIDLLYHLWFLPMVIGVVACSYVKSASRVAWRYLTSYLLLWGIQGTLIAYLLPAAGPALHGSMHAGPNRFAALNATLQNQDAFLRAHGSVGLYAVELQQALVTLFGQQSVAIGAGISAMPSMHNAMATLFACAAWSIGRKAGIAATLYAFVIWIASVHLGWHYALDGIVAWVLTILTWLVVGRLPAMIDRGMVGVRRRADVGLDYGTPVLTEAPSM